MQALPRVRVTADSQQWGKLAAFQARRFAHSGGKFLQAPELDSARGRNLSDVIRSSLAADGERRYCGTRHAAIPAHHAITFHVHLDYKYGDGDGTQKISRRVETQRITRQK